MRRVVYRKLFIHQWQDSVDITSFSTAALYTFAHPFVFPKSRWEQSVLYTTHKSKQKT